MKYIFKLFLSALLVVTTSYGSLLYNDEQNTFTEVSEQNLRDIICAVYDYTQEHNPDYQLPHEFVDCHRKLTTKYLPSKQELNQALQSVITWLSNSLVEKNKLILDEGERAPHSSSQQPVPPNNCCGDIDLALQLLRIINSRIKNIMVNCDLSGVYTVLAALTTPTVIVNCDLSGVFTVLNTDFNETWTILAALTTPTVVVNCDISGVYTVLKTIEEFEDLENHCPTELTSNDILPNGYTITIPGYYTLCGSIGFDAPGTSTCVINIQTSNVTLDLNQNTIYQADADAGLTGICVADSLTNIIIQNGYLSGFTSTGISVGNSANELVVKNISVNNCTDAGILFNGADGSPTRDVRVMHAQFSNNGNDGAQFLFTEKVKVHSSAFNDNTGVGALFFQSSSNEIVGSSFNQNGGAVAAAGLEFNGTSSSVIRDCIFNANSSSSASSAGFIITGTGNLIDNCVADGNSTSATFTAIGFDISGAAHILKNSSTAGNTALTGTGIGVRVNASAYRCLVQNTTAFTNSTYGFLHNGGAGQNFLIGNISGGQGTDAFNFSGAGLGWLSITAGMQITTFSENQRVNNVSLT